MILRNYRVPCYFCGQRSDYQERLADIVTCQDTASCESRIKRIDAVIPHGIDRAASYEEKVDAWFSSIPVVPMA